MKTCKSCKEDKALSDFGNLSESKDGLSYTCKSCKNAYYSEYRAKNSEKIAANHKKHSDKNPEKIAVSQKRYRVKNAEKISAYGKKYRTENPSYFACATKKYRTENPIRVAASQKRYKTENSDRVAASQKRYRSKNPGKLNAKNAMRHASKLQATPGWVNEGYVSLFYVGAKMEEKRMGRKVHVDHIIPLKGENVCGLHCEDNLQLLFAEDNIRKSNSHVVSNC